MLNLGLTGNVASGKSSVARHFAAWGATVVDADELVREAQRPGSETVGAIVRRFGSGILRSDGSLDRDVLRARVIGDDAARAALNAIVHPVVRRRRGELAAAAAERGDCVLVNDIPLLFEVLDPDDFDLIVLVDAPREVRRERLVALRGLSPDDADRLIATQLPAAPKRARSDVVIENAGSLADLERTAREAWRLIRRRAAELSTRTGGPLLAVFAHPQDEAFAVGGTLARYHDAGLATHLLCVTAGEAAARHDAVERRRTDLARAADVLGLASFRMLEFPDGRLDSHDAAGSDAVAATVRQLDPTVVITFGPDGATGDSDHVAVHHWVRTAISRVGSRCSVFYVAYPDDAPALSPRLRCARAEHIVAQLDVRPWRDVKAAAIAAHGSQRHGAELGLDEGTPRLPHDREWYTGEFRPRRRLTDLYERP